MTELAAGGLRALQTACVFVGLGVAVLRLIDAAPPAEFAHRWLQRQRILLGVALACGVGLLLVQWASVAPEGDARPPATLLAQLLTSSRFGHVWLLREALLAIALAAVLVRAPAAVPGVLLIVELGARPWSGHSAALDPPGFALAAHALHLVVTGAWLGTLPVLADRLRRDATGSAVPVFARFSPLALGLMVAIGASGAWLAIAHVARWPALLATPYGLLLLAKLAALGVVLALAAHLRARLLPALRVGRGDRRTVLTWLGAEIGAALLVLVLATALGQTIPAQHDAVEWWLPFRLSIDATWTEPWVPARVGGSAVLVIAACVLAVRQARRGRATASAVATAAVVAAAGTGIAMHALAVPAYPDTYRTPSVAYQTISVARGAALFARHCASCHGASGHGDGPAARGLAIPPADLTEPHTALHTAGDIFRWITHGKPPGPMPALADRTTEDDRWDIINFLRTLAAGYQARILGERVVPGRPWLPAIDFGYGTADGGTGSLQDFRERSAVLLVFFRLPDATARLAQLERERERLRTAGVEVLGVPIDGTTPVTTLPAVADGAAETAIAWSLLRRTLTDADARDRAPLPAHMECLVDRFGYVRARWLPREGEGWSRIDALLREAAVLAREPRILPPPDDHVH